MVEQKLTDQMIAKMEDLDRISTRLGKIANFVAFVGVIVAIAAVIPVLL